ncbi:hypothetical protein KGA66_26240 [Actinocrinis puniceicyclus]|uniref:RNA polymerase sigma-70 region 4 domain-containing protein n=1 Tax=Actinocrinis puniceicyclus TaxID=977794 RepID=A0A8J7WQB0_9ACTN|nr:hypothetical protein [Actinocrinis puniceicyclus]
MNTRARNAFARMGYSLVSDVLPMELGELLGLPNIGVGTVDLILRALADASANTETMPPSQPNPLAPDTGTSIGDKQQTWWGHSVVEDMSLLASWHAALGVPERPLLGIGLLPGAPSDVIKARQRLEAINSTDVLDPAQYDLDVASLLQNRICELDPRAQLILARRLFADRPQTLDELSRTLDVTRERVRQIEAKARSAMVDSLGRGDTLELVGSTVRDLVGLVLPLTDLLEFLPALGHTVKPVAQPAWRILDRLDDCYEIEDDWCASPTIAGAQSATLTRLQELADHYGVVRLEDIGALNAHQSDAAGRRALRSWLLYCGYTLDGEHVLVKTHSVGDRAAAILSIAGSPMASQEILDRLGVERTLGSLKNAMAADERFERVDRDRWALAEWGLQTYGGVRALLREEIARGAGQVALEDLIERITGRYSVTASSVVAYANAAPFETKAGVVRLAITDRYVRKSPERTRRLFRHDSQWSYRITVTKEHLRGSGSVAPVAIASLLGMQHGETRHLNSDLGPQSVSWVGPQPTFGTIRRFLIAQDFEIGSEAMLALRDDGSFHIEHVVARGTDPLEQALALAGITSAEGLKAPHVALARAILLPENSPAVSIIGGYRERGDEDIADLLTLAKDRLEHVSGARQSEPSVADIDEILRLL